MRPECSHNGVLTDMKIDEAVEDYIADREGEVAPQAMNSATHGVK